MGPILRRLTVAFLAAFLAPQIAAQVDYSLTFEPGGTHWTVAVRLPEQGTEALSFHLPLWTPGAYHVADYGRFVDELQAFDAEGRELEVERANDGEFVVSGMKKAGPVVVRYSARSMSSGLFTNNVIDVEANRIASGYAYVNPVSLFGFVPAQVKEPVRLEVNLPLGWKTATVLERDEAGRFLAPSYYRFEDSPLLFSPDLESTSFEVDGKPHRVSVHGRSAEELEAIAEGCKRIVEAGSALMRGLPYERYHFLYGFVDEAGGSGLEHSDSTLILVNSRTSTEPDSEGFWPLTAHEFFHLWCAERIHVAEIHEPDLTEPLETGTIWVNEGITEYFTRHLLLHAGFFTEEQLLGSYLGGGVPQGAFGKQSWTDVSRAASVWEGMQDLVVFAMRMYHAGPPTIFALDMTMRRATKGEIGVLDFVHHLNENYVKKDRGFGEDELADILMAVGGESAVEFYSRYIDGGELPEPAEYLDVLGYRAEGQGCVSLDEVSEAQAAARRDYFSITGQP